MCHLKLLTPVSSQDFIHLQAHSGCFSLLTLSFIPKAALRRASLEEPLLNTCSCTGGHRLPPPIYRVIAASSFPLLSLENKSTEKSRLFVSAGTAPKTTGNNAPRFEHARTGFGCSSTSLTSTLQYLTPASCYGALGQLSSSSRASVSPVSSRNRRSSHLNRLRAAMPASHPALLPG